MIKLLPPYGRKLKDLRLERGITQMYLEQEAFLSHGTVSRIETSKINPSKETLFRLAEAMQLSNREVSDLFCFGELLR